MAKKVLVDAKTLRALLDRVYDAARATHAGYDRKTGTYPWNSAIYKKSDPYEFKLYEKLRTALSD